MPFSDEPWESPESDLDAAQFCAVCLIDTNPSGADKIKALCKLPIRKTPGGPYSRSALRNAAGRIFQMTGVDAATRKQAAKRLVALMRESGIQVTSAALLQLAGVLPERK